MLIIRKSTKFLIFLSVFIFFYGPAKKMFIKTKYSQIVTNSKVCFLKTDPNKTQDRQIKELFNTQILLAPTITILDKELQHITIDIMFHKYKDLAKNECNIKLQK